MKKLIVMMFLLCATVPMQARGNGFSLGVSPEFSVGGSDNDASRWEIAVVGGYTLNLGRFFFNPEVSLYYENIKDGFYYDYPVGGPISQPLPAHYIDGNNFGGSVAAQIGFNFGAGIEAFTGPWGKYYFAKWENSKSGEIYYRRYSRAEALWRIGVGYTLWRFTLRASYNIRMTKHNDDPADVNSVNIALYYNF